MKFKVTDIQHYSWITDYSTNAMIFKGMLLLFASICLFFIISELIWPEKAFKHRGYRVLPTVGLSVSIVIALMLNHSAVYDKVTFTSPESYTVKSFGTTDGKKSIEVVNDNGDRLTEQMVNRLNDKRNNIAAPYKTIATSKGLKKGDKVVIVFDVRTKEQFEKNKAYAFDEILDKTFSISDIPVQFAKDSREDDK